MVWTSPRGQLVLRLVSHAPESIPPAVLQAHGVRHRSVEGDSRKQDYQDFCERSNAAFLVEFLGLEILSCSYHLTQNVCILVFCDSGLPHR